MDPHQHLASLLTGVAAGDRFAFALFFDATYPTVAAWVHPAAQPDDRDELVIAAYLRVWRNAPSFPNAAQDVTQWLANITAPALPDDGRDPPMAWPAQLQLPEPARRRWRFRFLRASRTRQIVQRAE